MKKKTISVLALSGFVLIATPATLVHTPFVENILKSNIENTISESTGEDCVIENLDIALFKGQLHLTNFSIRGRESHSDIISVDQIDLHFNPFRQGPLIRHIEINTPTISLEIDKDGLIQFRNRPIAIKKNRERLPWKTLSIRNANLHFKTPGFSLVLNDGHIKSDGELASMSYTGGELSTNRFSLPLDPFLVQDIVYKPNLLESKLFTIQAPEHLFHTKFSSNFKGDWSFLIDWYGSPKILLNSQTMYLEGNHHIQINANNNSIGGHFIINDAVVHRLNSKQGNILVGNPTGRWALKGPLLNINESVTNFGDGTLWFNSQIDLVNRDLSVKLMAENMSLYDFSKSLHLSKAPWVEGKLNIQSNLVGRFKPFKLEGKSTLVMSDFDVSSKDIKKNKPLLQHNSVKGEGNWTFTTSNMSFDFDSIEIDDNRLNGKANITLGTKKYFQFDFDFNKFNLASLKPMGGANLKGAGLFKGKIFGPPSSLKFEGQYNLSNFAIADIPFADTIEATVQSDDLKTFVFNDLKSEKGTSTITGPLSLNFTRPLSVKSELMATNANIEDLTSIFMDFNSLKGSATGKAKINGPVSNLDIITNFKLENAKIWGEKFQSGRFQLFMANKQITISELSLSKPQGDSILLRGSIQPDKTKQFHVLGSNLHVESFDSIKNNELPLTGRGQFNVLLDGQPLQPRGTIYFNDLRYDEFDLDSAQISFHGANKKITVKGEAPTAGLDLKGHFIDNGNMDYSLMVDMHRFPLHMFYPITANGTKLDSVLNGRMQISNQKGEGRKVIGNVDQLDILFKDMNLKSVQPWSFVHSNKDTRITDLMVVDNGKTSIKIDGRRAIDGNLDFLAQGQIDLALLKAFVPKINNSTGIGKVNGTIRGPFENPITEVNLGIENGYLTATWFPHPFESLNGNIKITPNRYIVDSLNGRVGGGDIDFNGYVASDSYSPDRVEIQSSFKQSQIKTLDILPSANATGDLQLTGAIDQLLLKGDVEINEMLFSDRINWENTLLEFSGDVLKDAAKEKKQKPPLSFHIGIKSDDKIRVRNNVADLSASASLQVVGDLSKPGIQGWVKGNQGGRVLIKERDFDVQRFDVRFTDPYTYDPELDIFMQTRVESLDQTIDIQYLISGRFRNWTAQTYSIPPLPQADINALLFFGMTRDEVERMGGLVSALAVEGSDLLASKFGVVEGFHSVSQGLFQGDLLNYLDRIDITSGSGARGSGSFSSALRVIAEKDLGPDSTIRFEKNLTETEDFYLSWEQKLADTFYAKGFWASEQQGRYLNIGGAYGMEFQLRWEAD